MIKSKRNSPTYDIEVKLPEPKSFLEKLNHIKENITVEPALICYITPMALGRLATQNLNLDKACRVNLEYGATVCDALVARKGDAYRNEEIEVQKLIASIETWKNFIFTAIPCIIILFVGAWSDRTGKRKILILLPIIGDLLMNLSNILNVYFFYEIPVQVTMFLEAFLPAIMGGYMTSFVGAFSYISDISSEETRTFRVGLVYICLTSGNPIGSALSGILLECIGYYGVFILCSVLNSFSIAYVFFRIKDPHRIKNNEGKPLKWKDSIKAFFDVNHVKDTLLVAFKDGPNKRKLKFVLIFFGIFFAFGPAYAEWSIRYLFTRTRFNWDALTFSYFSTFHMCIHIVGALIMIIVLNRRLKVDDSTLGIISTVSKVVGCTATVLARNTVEMYISTFIEMFNATSYANLRSISSKLVTSEELGKIVAMFNIVEVLTSMVFIPAYSFIYMVTLDIFAGLIFVISIIFTVPALSIFIWFYIDRKKQLKLINDGLDENINLAGDIVTQKCTTPDVTL